MRGKMHRLVFFNYGYFIIMEKKIKETFTVQTNGDSLENIYMIICIFNKIIRLRINL